MSEEVKERKKKTTKTAKFFGFLLVPSITILTFLILVGIFEGVAASAYKSNRKLYDLIGYSLLIISFLLAIGFGIKLAKRWDKFRKGKRRLLGFLVFMPAYIIAFIWIDDELGRAKRDDYNYKSYTEFEDSLVGWNNKVIVALIGDKEIRGSLIGESKKFITIEMSRRQKVLIPKDKILLMHED